METFPVTWRTATVATAVTSGAGVFLQYVAMRQTGTLVPVGVLAGGITAVGLLVGIDVPPGVIHRAVAAAVTLGIVLWLPLVIAGHGAWGPVFSAAVCPGVILVGVRWSPLISIRRPGKAGLT